jgi:hypothetical protein
MRIVRARDADAVLVLTCPAFTEETGGARLIVYDRVNSAFVVVA